MTKIKLDAELVFDRFLDRGDVLGVLQAVLLSKGPKWSAGLHIRRSPKERVPVNAQDPAGLREAVLNAAGDRGPTYHALVSQYGGGDERFSGSVELRGTTSALVVVVSIDQKPFAPTGGRILMGNDILIQARQKRIEGVETTVWLRDVFADLCRKTSPAWGAIRDDGEYWEKVMTEIPSFFAAGRDFSKFLPGLFWLNYFGKPYINVLGLNRIVSTPATSIQELDGGVLVQIYDDPLKWKEPDSKESLENALRHLGKEYFFDKEHPDQRTYAPDWKTSETK